jgi:hypothetical protein
MASVLLPGLTQREIRAIGLGQSDRAGPGVIDFDHPPSVDLQDPLHVRGRDFSVRGGVVYFYDQSVNVLGGEKDVRTAGNQS